MAYSLVGRSAHGVGRLDGGGQWQGGGEDDVRERTAWQDKHGIACFGCGKTFGALTNDIIALPECGRVVSATGSPGRTASRATRNRNGRATSATTP